jgi:hypothetical protein
MLTVQHYLLAVFWCLTPCTGAACFQLFILRHGGSLTNIQASAGIALLCIASNPHLDANSKATQQDLLSVRDCLRLLQLYLHGLASGVAFLVNI